MTDPGEFSTVSDPMPILTILNPSEPHAFCNPKKLINDGDDVSAFLVSKGYRDIMTFLMQLNRSMFPSYLDENGQHVQTWEIGSEQVEYSKTVRSLRDLLAKLEAVIDEVPPDTGPRRFGNVSFRKWYEVVREKMSDLLDDFLPPGVLDFGIASPESPSSRAEVESYFISSFGSAERLDFGSGHELSFLAFLGCIWKLGGFEVGESGVEERSIVIGVIEPYLNLCRHLIKAYTLEPAGSHGVWGLDDHFFLPYIFGSAQLSPAIRDTETIPLQGSLPGTPDPSSVSKATVVATERSRNMYFSAVGFIHDVKRGPFWEHSPMLYDISGVRTGWAKINKGMLKMYNAEVLSKFPVVQHFTFGSLFSFDRDSNAKNPEISAHLSNQPPGLHGAQPAFVDPHKAGSTQAPWAASSMPSPSDAHYPSLTSLRDTPLRDPRGGPRNLSSSRDPPLRNPLSGSTQSASTAQVPMTRAPWQSTNSGTPPPTNLPTRAPWAKSQARPVNPPTDLPTRAPWAQGEKRPEE